MLAPSRRRRVAGVRPAGTTMFEHRHAGLYAEGVPLSSIVDRVGTPVYVYSRAAVETAYQAFAAAFAGYPHAVHYALKANSTLAIARLFHQLGASADANSGGEIEVALRAGFRPEAIVFTGVGKTPEETVRALSLGVKAINIESPGEMERVRALAAGQGVTARIALRINPDIDPRSHPHVSTGMRATKFGVSLPLARGLYRQAAASPHLDPVGVHVHVGSQILDLAPLVAAARALAALTCDLRADGITLEYVDLGGGIGISYDGRPAPTPAQYAAAVLPVVRETGCPVVLEPGRVLVGPAAVLVTRVVDIKDMVDGPRFVVTDAGMTELLRPALYGAFHRIEPVAPSRSGGRTACHVVGPLCETSDTLGRDRLLPDLEPGDLLAVRDVGAYGSAMASNYNRRLLAPEVLVSGDTWRLIRRRQTLDDLLALEEVGEDRDGTCR